MVWPVPVADDDLPPTPAPVPTPGPVPAPSVHRIICECCGCQLTADGEVLRLGDEAKRVRRLDDKIEKADQKIRDLETENAELRRSIAATDNKRGWSLWN